MIHLLSPSRNEGSALIWQKGRMCTLLPATLWSTDVPCWSWAWALPLRSCRSEGRMGSSSSLPLLLQRALGSWPGGLCWLLHHGELFSTPFRIDYTIPVFLWELLQFYLEENYCWEQRYASVEKSDFSQFFLAMLTNPKSFILGVAYLSFKVGLSSK